MFTLTITEDRTGRVVREFNRRTRATALTDAYLMIDDLHSEADSHRMSHQIHRIGHTDGVIGYEPVTYRITEQS